MSLAIINIGQKHNGKTTRAIKLATSISNVSAIYVNDVQNESKYKSVGKITRFYGSMDGYINLMKAKRNSIFIIEEATMFFPHAASNSELVGRLLSARFSGNMYIMNFHALRQVPLYIIDYTDYMLIGKSKGNYNHLAKKFEDYPQIYESWQRVLGSDDKYAFLQVKI